MLTFNRITSLIMNKVVVLAGISGAGKSTVAKALPGCFPWELDHYYHNIDHYPRDENNNINFDDPSALRWNLIRRHLGQLINNRRILRPTFDMNANPHADPFYPGITIAGAVTGSIPLEPESKTIIVDSHMGLLLPPDSVDSVILIDTPYRIAQPRRTAERPAMTPEIYYRCVVPGFERFTLGMLGQFLGKVNSVDGTQTPEKLISEVSSLI
jgi:uridine kinase